MLSPFMIPLDEFKQLLGPDFDHLPETELKAIRDSEDRLAGLLFDRWLKDRKHSPDSTVT